MEVTEYVAGFVFDRTSESVALIHKIRPKWQRNKLNGIGGHIEDNEQPINAMIREFKEEAGIVITGWRHFCTLFGNGYEHEGDWRVYFFLVYFARDKLLTELGGTDEEVFWVRYNHLREVDVLPNLHWLIPMALSGPSGPFGTVWPFLVEEKRK